MLFFLRRSASNTDLKGFHTPHGGSSSDLTELSSPTDRDSASSEGMGNLIAAAAALGPDDRQFPAATPAAAAAGQEEEEGRGGRVQDQSRAVRGEASPSDWSMGPESPTNTAAAASGAAAAAAAAAATGTSAVAAKHRRAAATSSPVMSLSGHLIGPEVRRGGGTGDMKKCAHDAFMKEVVTWDDFSRRPQVRRAIVSLGGFCSVFR